jgi:hypothetical protein
MAGLENLSRASAGDDTRGLHLRLAPTSKSQHITRVLANKNATRLTSQLDGMPHRRVGYPHAYEFMEACC